MLKVGSLVLALTGLTPFVAHAESNEQALQEITNTADKICGIVAAKGETSTVAVKGQVNAELNGLAKRLANLGISGTGDITSSSYEGIVQQDLTSTLKDVRECKLKVFERLEEKLVAAPQKRSDLLEHHESKCSNIDRSGKNVLARSIFSLMEEAYKMSADSQAKLFISFDGMEVIDCGYISPKSLGPPLDKSLMKEKVDFMQCDSSVFCRLFLKITIGTNDYPVIMSKTPDEANTYGWLNSFLIAMEPSQISMYFDRGWAKKLKSFGKDDEIRFKCHFSTSPINMTSWFNCLYNCELF